jgi:hypothetical protein
MNSIPKMERFTPTRAACSGLCQKGHIDTHVLVVVVAWHFDAEASM